MRSNKLSLFANRAMFHLNALFGRKPGKTSDQQIIANGSGGIENFRSEEDRLADAAYLERYPDVKAAVDAGWFSSGLAHWLVHGRREDRHWPQDLLADDSVVNPFAELADENFNKRIDYLTYGIDQAKHAGIEIGALNWPIISPMEGNVKFVDYATTLELKKTSYASDRDRIVHVDYVWTGSGSLANVVGRNECFDYAIASHVIEHIPNVLGWFRGVAEVLKPGGRFNLAIPDRRFTFDLQRQETTLAQWVEADLLGFTTPSPRQVFDHASQVRHVQPGEPWTSTKKVWEYPLMSGAEATRVALDQARQVADRGTYIDTHCSVFTPMSFMELFTEATKLDLIDLRIDRIHATPPANSSYAEHSGFEFFVNLSKPTKPSRLGLILQAEATRDRLRVLDH
jgi:SAM-dependent methyltransferase